MTEEPEPLPAELAEAARDYAASAFRATERQLAESGECPAPEELAALAAGTIDDGARREALAHHLLACPRCFDANLARLAPGAAPVGGEAGRERRRRFALVSLAAVAAVVLVGLFLAGPWSRAPQPITSVFWVDADGIVLRGVEGNERRIQVACRAGGHLALLRVDAEGLVAEPVEDGESWARVHADEDVIVPLDRTLVTRRGQTYVLLYAPRLVSDAERIRLARRALAGSRLPSGFVARVLRL